MATLTEPPKQDPGRQKRKPSTDRSSTPKPDLSNLEKLDDKAQYGNQPDLSHLKPYEPPTRPETDDRSASDKYEDMRKKHKDNKSELADKEKKAENKKGSDSKPEENERDNLDNKKIPYQKNGDDTKSRTKIKAALTSRSAVVGGGFLSVTGIFIAFMMIFGQILGLHDLANFMDGFFGGSNDSFISARNLRVTRSLIEGRFDIRQVRVNEKIGKHNGRISQRILGVANKDNRSLIERSIENIEDKGAIVHFEEFEDVRGNKINEGGQKLYDKDGNLTRYVEGERNYFNSKGEPIELPEDFKRQVSTGFTSPEDGKTHVLNHREQNIDIKRSERRKVEKAAAKDYALLRDNSIKGVMKRSIFGDRFVTHLGLDWSRRLTRKSGEVTEAIRSKAFARRQGAKDVDGLNEVGKQVEREITKGASVEAAKETVATKIVVDKIGKGAGIFSFAAFSGCFVHNQFLARADILEQNYLFAMRTAMDNKILAAEIGEFFRIPGFSDTDLDSVGETNHQVLAAERTRYETNPANPSVPIAKSYIDTFANSQVWRIVSNSPTLRGAEPIADHFILGNNDSEFQQKIIEGIGGFINRGGKSVEVFCDAFNFKLFSAPGIGDVTVGSIGGTIIDTVACVTSATVTGGIATAACVAGQYAAGEAMGYLLSHFMDFILAPHIGFAPSTIVQNMEMWGQGEVLESEAEYREGAPEEPEVVLKEARAYQNAVLEDLNEQPIKDRFFAVAPGSPGLKLAQWKLNATMQPIHKTAAQFVSNIPGTFIGAVADVVSGQVYADEVSKIPAEEVYYGHTTRSLSHLAEADVVYDENGDEVFDPYDFQDAMAHREDCLYEIFYDLDDQVSCNGTVVEDIARKLNDVIPSEIENEERTYRDLSIAFAQDCMGLRVNSADEGPTVDLSIMKLAHEGDEVADNKFAELCTTQAAANSELYNYIGVYMTDMKILEAYERYFEEPVERTPQDQQFGQDGANTVAGIECPSTLTAHPNKPGYYTMPEQSDLFYYQGNTPPRQRYGSRELVCTIYTVAKNWAALGPDVNGGSTIRVGDLTASGHATHNRGTAIDLSTGDNPGSRLNAANKARGAGYSAEATVALGKLFVDTGYVRQILWCDDWESAARPHGRSDGSSKAIRDYSNQPGKKPVRVRCVVNHHHHFHVDIDTTYNQSEWKP